MPIAFEFTSLDNLAIDVSTVIWFRVKNDRTKYGVMKFKEFKINNDTVFDGFFLLVVSLFEYKCEISAQFVELWSIIGGVNFLGGVDQLATTTIYLSIQLTILNK